MLYFDWVFMDAILFSFLLANQYIISSGVVFFLFLFIWLKPVN